VTVVAEIERVMELTDMKKAIELFGSGEEGFWMRILL